MGAQVPARACAVWPPLGTAACLVRTGMTGRLVDRASARPAAAIGMRADFFIVSATIFLTHLVVSPLRFKRKARLLPGLRDTNKPHVVGQ